MTKFLDIVKSPRFIQLAIIALLQALVLFNVISSEQGSGLIDIISGLLGASVVIRTVDKNIGDAKIIAAGIDYGDIGVKNIVNLPPEK